MNTGFYKDLDTNFEQALEMSEKDFTHSELILMLKEGNIPEKQIAALRLDCIKSAEEADILVSNLTGCDGKIREAVALKINSIISKQAEIAHYFYQANVFADASIDINANICRLVIDTVMYLKNDKTFAEKYLDCILKFIAETFGELDNFIFRDKKYVINKQLFKLYWSLEALKLFANEMSLQTLLPILEKASLEREYTIREKVAQIVVMLDKKDVDILVKRLSSDENYYVRNAINLH